MYKEMLKLAFIGSIFVSFLIHMETETTGSY